MSMGKLGLGMGMTPGGAAIGTPTGITLSNNTVDDDIATGMTVGLLSATWDGNPGTGTFSITSDPDNKFDVSGNELITTASMPYSTATPDHAVTVQFDDGRGNTVSQAFTINLTEVDTATEPDLGAGGVVVDDGNFTVTPSVTKADGLTRIQGKNGGLAKFIYEIGSAAAGNTYTVKYTADWPLLSNQGKEAFAGFGFVDNNSAANDFHFVGIKGDGGSGVKKYRITGDDNFNGSSGFTQTDGGAPTNGTQSGPNWIQIAIAEDGLDYIFRTSSDGVSWTDEFTDIVPSPFTDPEAAGTFGIAVFLQNSDKGSFTLDIETYTLATAGYPTPVFIGTSNDTSNLSSYSFNSIDISSAAEDESRKIIIGIQAVSATGSSVPTDVTIDISGGASGVACERVFNQGGNNALSLWTVDCPSGSTIDINVTFGASRNWCHVTYWGLYTGADPAEAYSVGAADPASVTLQTIDRIQLGGGNTFMIGGAQAIDNAALYTWGYTGANSLTINERVNVVMESTYNVNWVDALPSTDEIDASFDVEQTGAGGTMYAWAVVFTIGPVAIDPFASDVVFLAHFEGTNGDTSYSEETANAYPGTFAGAAQISNSPTPWEGNTSLYIGTGTAADEVEFSTAPVPILDFTEPWTVEFVINLSNTSGLQYIISQWDTAGNERAWGIYWNAPGLGFYYSTNGSNFFNIVANIAISAGFFYPAAVQFDGSVVRAFIADAHSGALTPSGAMHVPASTTKLVIGNRQANDLPLKGSIDRLRITKGNYRYGMVDSYYGPRRFPAVV